MRLKLNHITCGKSSAPFLVYKCLNVDCYYYCYVTGDLTESIHVLERPHRYSQTSWWLSHSWTPQHSCFMFYNVLSCTLEYTTLKVSVDLTPHWSLNPWTVTWHLLMMQKQHNPERNTPEKQEGCGIDRWWSQNRNQVLKGSRQEEVSNRGCPFSQQIWKSELTDQWF